MAEAGFPAVELSSWSALFLPARTPGPVVAAMATATAQALRDPKVVELFNGSAVELWPEMGPDRLRALLSAEIPRIRELLEQSGSIGG
jgi:tripartite-type tricarboxylate transporter receptor subunit TctC